jgi:amino acid permease
MYFLLIFGATALYMLIGWIIVMVLDRRGPRERTSGMLWFAVVLWPISLIIELIVGRGPDND